MRTPVTDQPSGCARVVASAPQQQQSGVVWGLCARSVDGKGPPGGRPPVVASSRRRARKNKMCVCFRRTQHPPSTVWWPHPSCRREHTAELRWRLREQQCRVAASIDEGCGAVLHTLISTPPDAPSRSHRAAHRQYCTPCCTARVPVRRHRAVAGAERARTKERAEGRTMVCGQVSTPLYSVVTAREAVIFAHNVWTNLLHTHMYSQSERSPCAPRRNDESKCESENTTTLFSGVNISGPTARQTHHINTLHMKLLFQM